ncbi:hypothetical protein P43SY_001549 [Pythium insidiosum]|uniref:CCHC-type domain-containing protein n=1 Tax=Pythium insidiosum TaxID=114742 RepID=A0AAD5M583_PYTIN|nr:hypothetical protein P43SY_001549 [Pythium insidiosum]
MWKDKVLTHVSQLDLEYQRSLLEKDQPDAKVLMKDFLFGSPAEPPVPAPGIGQDEARAARCAQMHWRRAKSATQDLLNKALPNTFLSTLPDAVSKMDPCEIWKALEKTYGLGDAGGLIELTRQWTKLAGTSFRDLGTHFAMLKKLRNDINRKSQALVKRDMVTEEWLCIEVLAQLPSEFWASAVSLTPDGFTVEQVEAGLRRVFGDKSKRDISHHLEKRPLPVHVNAVRNHAQRKRKTGTEDSTSCFYCFGSGHYKKDCPVLKSDRDPNRAGGPLFRTDVNTAPGAKKLKVGKVTRAPDTP